MTKFVSGFDAQVTVGEWGLRDIQHSAFHDGQWGARFKGMACPYDPECTEPIPGVDDEAED